jgi:hypothetical protein
VDKNFAMDADAIARQIKKLIVELTVLERMVSEGVPTFPADRLTLVAEKVCLNCNKPLGKSRDVRGCHEYCYKQVKSSIKAGEMTEFEAVEAGLVLPKEVGGGRKPTGTQLAKLLAQKSEEARIESLASKDDPTRKSGASGRRARKTKGAEG